LIGVATGILFVEADLTNQDPDLLKVKSERQSSRAMRQS